MAKAQLVSYPDGFDCATTWDLSACQSSGQFAFWDNFLNGMADHQFDAPVDAARAQLKAKFFIEERIDAIKAAGNVHV